MTKAADLAKLIAGGGSITVDDNSDNVTLTSTDADANAGPNLRMYRNSASPADVDRLGHITFDGRNDNSQDFTAAQIQVFTEDASDGEEDSSVTFTCINGGSSNNAIQINPTETTFNESSVDRDFRVESDANTHALFLEGSSGKVGIGTSSPTSTLTVKAFEDSVNGGIRFESNDGSENATIDFNNSAALRFRTNGSDRMRILDSSGNVGIGTTSPSRTFHVSSSSGTAVKVETSDNDKALIEFANNGTSTTCFLGSADDDMQFGTGGSERMRIDSGGNVGINRTPNSTIKLDVETSGTNHPARFKSDHVSYGTIFDNIAGSGNRFFCDFRINNSTKGKIFSDGSTTTFSTSSDYRLKENVVTDWDATTRLKQLKPSRFNFKEDKDTTYDGFLAHEVSSIVPEAVDGEKDAVDSDGNIDPQGIDHSKLVPLMVKTIQELEERIAKLEAK